MILLESVQILAPPTFKELLLQPLSKEPWRQRVLALTANRVGTSRDCPQKMGKGTVNAGPKGKTPVAPALCPRCHRDKHWANECHSKTDINCQPIRGPLGNSSWPSPAPAKNRGPDSGIPAFQLSRATSESAGLDLCPTA